MQLVAAVAPLQASDHKSAKSRLRSATGARSLSRTWLSSIRRNVRRRRRVQLRIGHSNWTRGKAATFNGACPPSSLSFAINSGDVAKTWSRDSRIESKDSATRRPIMGSVIDYRYHYCHRIIAPFVTALGDTALMRTIVSVVLPRVLELTPKARRMSRI